MNTAGAKVNNQFELKSKAWSTEHYENELEQKLFMPIEGKN